MTQSNLSYEEYAAWCTSRFPGWDQSEQDIVSLRPTVLACSQDECPVTVRSFNDQDIVTPRPKGSV